MTYVESVSATIHSAADLIERRQHVSTAGIPSLVTLLRGLAEAASEHAAGGELPGAALCADEVDALTFARVELGKKRGQHERTS